VVKARNERAALQAKYGGEVGFKKESTNEDSNESPPEKGTKTSRARSNPKRGLLMIARKVVENHGKKTPKRISSSTTRCSAIQPPRRAKIKRNGVILRARKIPELLRPEGLRA